MDVLILLFLKKIEHIGLNSRRLKCKRCKYPGVVGFNPHQDYNYWNKYGVQFPEAHAAFIAIDECTLENGCLQIIPKTHLLGILPHDNLERGDADHGIKVDVYNSLLDIGYQPKHIIMEPGDVVFFHGNTVNLSDDNNSNNSRIAMLVTLNTKRSSPLPSKNIGHPYYIKHHRVFDTITEDDLNLPNPDFAMNY